VLSAIDDAALAELVLDGVEIGVAHLLAVDELAVKL
jgi:hypothetical protein